MKKFIISLALISAVLLPMPVSFAQNDNSVSSESLTTKLEELKSQVIAMLLQQIADLTKQLNDLIAKQQAQINTQSNQIAQIQQQVQTQPIVVQQSEVVSTSTQTNNTGQVIEPIVITSSTQQVATTTENFIFTSKHTVEDIVYANNITACLNASYDYRSLTKSIDVTRDTDFSHIYSIHLNMKDGVSLSGLTSPIICKASGYKNIDGVKKYLIMQGTSTISW